MANKISNTKTLFKFLMRETEKLPKDAAVFYRNSIRQGYIQHAEEDDPERLKQIIQRSVEDADWIVKKYTKK